MKMTITLYGLSLALAAVALDWIQFRYVARVFDGDPFDGKTSCAIKVGKQKN